MKYQIQVEGICQFENVNNNLIDAFIFAQEECLL